MSSCSKFKICTMCSGIRIRCFSAGKQTEGSKKAEQKYQNSEKDTTLDTQQCIRDSINSNCFVTSANARYMEYLFSKWIKNKESVHKSWHQYFSDLLTCKKDSKKLKNSKLTTSTKPAELNSDKEDTADYLDLFAKLDEATAPKSVEGPQNQKSTDKPVEMNYYGFNDSLQSQKPNTVVGTIILSQKSNDAINEPISTQDLVTPMLATKQRRPFANNNQCDLNESVSISQKRIEQMDQLNTMERLQTALDQKTFDMKRDDIKAQLKLIRQSKWQKSMEQQKQQRDAEIIAKYCKQPNEKSDK